MSCGPFYRRYRPSRPATSPSPRRCSSSAESRSPSASLDLRRLRAPSQIAIAPASLLALAWMTRTNRRTVSERHRPELHMSHRISPGVNGGSDQAVQRDQLTVVQASNIYFYLNSQDRIGPAFPRPQSGREFEGPLNSDMAPLGHYVEASPASVAAKGDVDLPAAKKMGMRALLARPPAPKSWLACRRRRRGIRRRRGSSLVLSTNRRRTSCRHSLVEATMSSAMGFPGCGGSLAHLLPSAASCPAYAGRDRPNRPRSPGNPQASNGRVRRRRTCGIPRARLASSTLSPRGTLTTGRRDR